MSIVRHDLSQAPRWWTLVTVFCALCVLGTLHSAAQSALVCRLRAPDTIAFDVDKYVPSPFELKLEISNTGSEDAKNVTAYVLQDARFNIEPPALRHFGDLAAGRTIAFEDSMVNGPFLLKVNPRTTDGYDTMRVLVVADGFPPSFCLIPIYVMSVQSPRFQLKCYAVPDLLVFDDQLNDYVPNPFDVVTTVANIGETKAENCQLVFIGAQGFALADGSQIVMAGAGGRMHAGDTATHTWKLVPLHRSVGGWETLSFQIQGRGGMGNSLVISECKVRVYVPPARAADYQMTCIAPAWLTFDNSAGVYIPDPGRPSLSCTTQSSMACTGDTLYFNFTLGDYRDCNGTRSSTGTYNVFTIASHILNGGVARANRVRAILLPPEGVSLDVGDSAIKDVGDLPSGGSANVSWTLRPDRHNADARRVFTILLTADNATQMQCEKAVTIMGVPGKTRRVRMPTGIQARTRDRIAVPVYVDSTIQHNVSAYALNVQFDPEALRFMDAVSVNTLTAQGWRGPRTSLHAVAQGGDPNVVRVEDLGYRTASSSSANDILVFLIFEAVYEGGPGQEVHDTPLNFLESIEVQSGGQTVTLGTSIQCADEHHPDCEAPLTFEGGSVSIISDIRIPILGGTEYALSQNTPNPVTGSTVIEYQLGEATEVRLEVFDILGRAMAVLAQGWKPAGRYAAAFDATGLAPGVYIYRLETSGYSKARSMLLVR